MAHFKYCPRCQESEITTIIPASKKLCPDCAKEICNDKIKRAIEILKKNIVLVKMMPALCISQDIQEAIKILEEQ